MLFVFFCQSPVKKTPKTGANVISTHTPFWCPIQPFISRDIGHRISCRIADKGNLPHHFHPKQHRSPNDHGSPFLFWCPIPPFTERDIGHQITCITADKKICNTPPDRISETVNRISGYPSRYGKRNNMRHNIAGIDTEDDEQNRSHQKRNHHTGRGLIP